MTARRESRESSFENGSFIFSSDVQLNGFNLGFGGGRDLVCCEELDVVQATWFTYTEGVAHVGNRIRLPWALWIVHPHVGLVLTSKGIISLTLLHLLTLDLP